MRRRTLLLAPASLLLAPASLLLAPASLLLAAAERLPVAATPLSRLETAWWRNRHQAKLAEARTRPIDLVWLGDSITQFWETDGPEPWREYAPVWQHFYGDRHALNLGFIGDNTAHLLWRIQNGELDGLHPKAAIILIGANNMGRVHWSAPQTVSGIEAVVNECRRRLPTTRILLLGILPSIRNDYVTRTTARVNQALDQQYAANKVPNVAYMDLTRLFLKNGAVDPSMFVDIHLTPPDPPLHPNPHSMALIAEAIEPTLATMLNDRPKPPVG